MMLAFKTGYNLQLAFTVAPNNIPVYFVTRSSRKENSPNVRSQNKTTQITHVILSKVQCPILKNRDAPYHIFYLIFRTLSWCFIMICIILTPWGFQNNNQPDRKYYFLFFLRLSGSCSSFYVCSASYKASRESDSTENSCVSINN